jgi:hypothetical protein
MYKEHSMNKNSLKRSLAALPFVAASALGVASSASAADFTALDPQTPIPVFNKFDYNGTLSILPDLTNGVIFVDFEPFADDAYLTAFGGGLGASCATDPAGPTPDPACTAAINTANNAIETEGVYGYANAPNGGIGFFNEFEGVGAGGNNGVIADVVFPVFIPTTGRNISINNFLRMDAQTFCSNDPNLAPNNCASGTADIQAVPNPLAVDSGENFFNASEIFPVDLEEQLDGNGNVLRTILSFTVDGEYVGPDTGPANGSVSFAVVFDGLSEAQVNDALFISGTGGDQLSYTARGTIQAVPEPGTILGLAAVASSGLLLRKGKKQNKG